MGSQGENPDFSPGKRFGKGDRFRIGIVMRPAGVIIRFDGGFDLLLQMIDLPRGFGISADHPGIEAGKFFVSGLHDRFQFDISGTLTANGSGKTFYGIAFIENKFRTFDLFP